MAVDTICNFFKYGYCKFKMSCKNKHVTTVCDDEKCKPKECEKRHPRLCKYVAKYGSCKLGSICAYSHENHERKNENQRLEKKLDELIVMVTKKDDMIVMCENKIEDLMQKNREKDAIIEKLVRDVKDLETMVKNEIISKEGNSSSKKKENIHKEIPSKAEDVTPVCDDKKNSLRSAKKKEKLQENCEEVEDKQVRGGCFGRSAVPRPRYPLRDTPGPYRDTPGPYRDGAGPYRHCAAQYRHTIPPPPSPRHSPSPHPTRSRTRPDTVPVPTETVTATQHCTTLISDICYILTLIDIDI